MQWKQPRLILQRAIVTLMIRCVYFLHPVLLTPSRSDQTLRKLRITSALFVCCKERTLFFERSRQGHLPGLSSKQTEKQSYPIFPIEYRFFFTCPLCWCIHPKAMHYIRVYMPILWIIQEYLTQRSRHSSSETWYIRQCFLFGASCLSSCQSTANIPVLFLLRWLENFTNTYYFLHFICNQFWHIFNTLQTWN